MSLRSSFFGLGASCARTLGRALAGALIAAGAAHAGVDVNLGNVDDLQRVHGIGKRLAHRIVNERADRGLYADWPDLVDRVSEVSAQTAQKLSDGGLLVQGSTFTTAVRTNPAGRHPAPVQATGQAAHTKDGGTTPMTPPGIGTMAPAEPDKAATQ